MILQSTISGNKPGVKTTLQAVHPVLMASDVRASVIFYARLGFTPIFQDNPPAPRYAVIRRDGVELHLQWAALSQFSTTGDRPVYRFLVEDIDALYAEFKATGALNPASRSPWAAPSNPPWGTREFHLHDPDWNGLQFYKLL